MSDPPPMPRASDFDPEVLLVFDQYVHGDIDRRTFLARMGKFAVGTVTAAGLLGALSPRFAEAQQVLKNAVARDRENPFAWYQLGVVYAANGDLARAHLASAEQQVMNWQMPQALRSAQAAEAALPKDSPDWLRAQDIAMQARAAIERANKRR